MTGLNLMLVTVTVMIKTIFLNVYMTEGIVVWYLCKTITAQFVNALSIDNILKVH